MKQENSGKHFYLRSNRYSAHVTISQVFAALSAGRVSAVEYCVPSFFEANVAQNLRLERLERGRFPSKFGLHSHDLLLKFIHFRVREKGRGRRRSDATTSATFGTQ